jgi:hypothetical protein
MSSRIEQIIEEIEEYVDSCKFQPLSTTKIVVNKEELEELLRELRMKTPEEIKRYQKIISNKDAILADAQVKSDSIVAEAKAHMEEMINENEIMKNAVAQSQEVLADATRRAQEIVDNAVFDANNIRSGAITYTDDMLANLEDIMGHTIETAGVKYHDFINSMQSCYEIVNKNRTELSGGAYSSQAAAPIEEYDVYEEELD